MYWDQDKQEKVKASLLVDFLGPSKKNSFSRAKQTRLKYQYDIHINTLGRDLHLET